MISMLHIHQVYYSIRYGWCGVLKMGENFFVLRITCTGCRISDMLVVATCKLRNCFNFDSTLTTNNHLKRVYDKGVDLPPKLGLNSFIVNNYWVMPCFKGVSNRKTNMQIKNFVRQHGLNSWSTLTDRHFCQGCLIILFKASFFLSNRPFQW